MPTVAGCAFAARLVAAASARPGDSAPHLPRRTPPARLAASAAAAPLRAISGAAAVVAASAVAEPPVLSLSATLGASAGAAEPPLKLELRADDVKALAAKAAEMASALEAFDFPTDNDWRRLEQVREKELGSRVRRAAPRRPREAGTARTSTSRARLSREDLTPEETVYEHAVQRTLRGVRSRTGFGATADRARSRADDNGGGDDNSLSMMKEMGQTPLLTAAEEVSLARQIQDLLELERMQAALHAELNRKPTTAEWAAAAGMAVPAFSDRLRRGHAAKDHMVQANLRLVVSIAKKYTRRGMSFQDLVQEGSTGLIRGVEKFEHERGYKLSTYAHWWIRQAVTRAIADHSRTVRLPVHLFEIMSRMKKSQQKLAAQLGREPSESELAAEVGLTPEKVRLIHKSAITPLSLDAPVGSDDKKPKTLEEVVEDEAVEAPERSVGYNLLREDMDGVLGTLTYREREVLRLRYGLTDGHTKTLEEVGCVFRVTRERIRQIEAKALRKLRQPQRHSALSEHLAERSNLA